MYRYSVAYALVKKLVYAAFRLSHRRIVVVGEENIPTNKPVVFAANHQNALMDPLAVLLTNSTQPVWLARADIFRKKMLVPIFRFLKIIPVYRLRDGKDSLQQNDHTFDTAVEVLENNLAIALFPEGAHSGKRRMLAHKKAVPRIVFRAEEKHGFTLGVQIVPVGIYYDHYWNFNRSLIVQYGEPIFVSDYRDQFCQNEQLAVQNLREELFNRIHALSMNIPSEEYYTEYEQIRELLSDGWTQEKHGSDLLSRFSSDCELMEAVARFENANPQLFEHLMHDLKTLTSASESKGFSLGEIQAKKRNCLLQYCLFFLLVLCLLPVFLPGLFVSGWQFLLARRWVGKKVKDPVFTSSFNFVLGLLLFPLSWIVLAALTALWAPFWIVLLLFLAMPGLGKLSFFIWEVWRKRWRMLRWCRFASGNQDQSMHWVTQKERFVMQFSEALEDKTTIFGA